MKKVMFHTRSEDGVGVGALGQLDLHFEKTPGYSTENRMEAVAGREATLSRE